MMRRPTLTVWWFLVSGFLGGAMVWAEAGQINADPALVLHYTFDEDPGDSVQDLSTHGNDGKVVKAEYLDELDGHRGVLRFDGETAMIDCPGSESLSFEGDLSVEMWVRLNAAPGFHWSSLVQDAGRHSYGFGISSGHTLVLWYLHMDPIHGITRSWHPAKGREQLVLPVDRSILSAKWSHIAVVVEYPRCRFYHDGRLVRDAYMPLPGIARLKTGTHIGVRTPMDLDEIRLYRRALSAAEVAAHARGEPAVIQPHHELAVEPHWYDQNVTVRLSCKGTDLAGHTAQVTIQGADESDALTPQTVPLSESNEGSGRFVGAAVFPLAALEGRSVDAVARIHNPDGKAVATVYRHANLKKPEWVHSQAGFSDQVPAPWTAVQAQTESDGTVEVAVWGRRHVFGATPLPQQIHTGGVALLGAPSALVGRADGENFRWSEGRVRLIDTSPTVAHLEQSWQDERLSIRLAAEIEFDGFMLIDGTVQARRNFQLDELRIEIPLDSQYAQLSYGHTVYPWNAEVPIKSFQSGKIEADQAFRFTQTAWLGDDERGLCWHGESDEYWRNGNEQNALEILPRGPITTFRMNLIDVPTDLVEGQVLQYRFSLQATPIKPRLRDAWDLRIARQEPYGRALELPDRLIKGQPAAQYLADRGVRHLLTMVCDVWPYPLPQHQPYARLMHRLNDVIHAHGMKHYNYQLHERYSVMAPEWDIHGLHMASRPLSQYIPRSLAGEPRPGPVGTEYGANSQGTQYFCHKSMALQDASVHAVARRLDAYGDDGIYLDGTVRAKSCTNLRHGCGYRLPDGSVRPTFAVFAVRDFMKRIYHVVKQRRPDGVVDAHCSFMYNPGALAFADVIWTGEQFPHLKKTGGAPDGYVAGELSLERFRTEFTGRQIGVAAEMLHYRLGSFNDVAATSLLHDVPSRPSTPFHTDHKPLSQRVGSMDSYFHQIAKLWRLRDQFGAKEAEKLFYWNNQAYVRVSPEKCYSTLMIHPTNGVLAFISNLRPDAATVSVGFNLDKLDLRGPKPDVFNPLSDEPVAMSLDGKISMFLESEEWAYVWLRPKAARRE